MVRKNDLHRVKVPLRKEQNMDGVAIVDDVARKAGLLVSREFRGPGDTIEAAMSRAERRWGIPFTTFWALRYRKPKDVLASVYCRINEAYDAEVSRQEAKLRHEIEITRKVLGDAADHPALRAAEAVLAATEERLT